MRWHIPVRPNVIFKTYGRVDEPAREGLLAGKQAAQKALMLDDALAEARIQAGMARAFYDWDWTGAEMEFRSALDLYAGNPAWLHDWCGFFFALIGRFDDVISQYKQALELDPLSAGIHADFGGALLEARRYDQAIEESNKILE